MTIVAITGHRAQHLGGEGLTNPRKVYVLKQLEEKLLQIKPKATKAITGMALGVDTWFAEICIKLNIPFVAAIPFVGQEKIWNEQQQRKYHELLMEAHETIVVAEGEYAAYKMQKRNKWMVDNCDLLLAVFDGTSGGTANCINYAKTIERSFVIINPENY